MVDESDTDTDRWKSYDALIDERSEQVTSMLEQFEISRPGPPYEFPEPPDFFLPPPPIPGIRKECFTYSSHLESCDVIKVKLSSKRKLKRLPTK